jgi:hypothetical protein
MAEALEKAKAAVRVAEENQRVAMTGYCDKMGTCKCGQEMVVFSRALVSTLVENQRFITNALAMTFALTVQLKHNGPLMNNSHLL